MPEISVKNKLQELAAKDDSEIVTDSMFQLLWADLDQFGKRYLYDHALKLIEEKRMTFVVSQLIIAGLDIEDAELIEELIKNKEEIPIQDDWSDEIKFKIQELINRHA